DGIRDRNVTGVQTCALPIYNGVSYSVRDLERALIIPERDRAIIRKWHEKAEGKPTIAFCCSITHAERVAESFASSGITTVAYTRSEERRVGKECRYRRCM